MSRTGTLCKAPFFRRSKLSLSTGCPPGRGGFLRDCLLRRRWMLELLGNERKRQLLRSLFPDRLPEGHSVPLRQEEEAELSYHCLCHCCCNGRALDRVTKKSADQIGKKCPKNVRKLCWQCLRTFFEIFCCKSPGLLQESLGVSLEPFGPRAPKCPKSVPRVSPECQKGVRIPRGHSRDTFWTLRSPGPEGPQRHPEGHPEDTPGTLRALRARETPVAGRGDYKFFAYFF